MYKTQTWFHNFERQTEEKSKENAVALSPNTSLIKPLISAAHGANVVLFCLPVCLQWAAGVDYVAQPFQKPPLTLLPHDPSASQRFYSRSQTGLHLQEEEEEDKHRFAHWDLWFYCSGINCLTSLPTSNKCLNVEKNCSMHKYIIHPSFLSRQMF